jgi:predicted translin family RNA/ssDNA-binding protein
MRAMKFEIFDSLIEIAFAKTNANLIRLEFNELAANEVNQLRDNFYEKFSSLDELYEKSDDLAHDIMAKAITRAMKSLASYEIYDISEEQMYSHFISPYVRWDSDFEPIASRYEALVENAAQLDGHRTARRQGRAKWVGFNQKAVYDADAKNLISNVGHGAFNLMAKGVTAIGNSFKKDEIYKNRETVSQVADGVGNIVEAVYHGTVDALNLHRPGIVYSYSREEISKAKALVESVERGRVPEEKIFSNLQAAVESYPYIEEIYTLMLHTRGAGNGTLSVLAAYFGMSHLDGEKRRLFDTKLKEANLSNLTEFHSNTAKLHEYAELIDYPDAQSKLDKVLEKLKDKEFGQEVRKYSVQTLADLDQHAPSLQEFANRIEFEKFPDWMAARRQQLEAFKKEEEIKQQRADELATKSKFTQFLLSDDPSAKKKRGAITILLVIIIYVMWKWMP